MRDLYEQGRLQPASSEEIIEVAEARLKRGEVKRALVTVQTLYDREETRNLETILVVADLLKRCGEARMAGGVLLDAAQQMTDPEDTLELAQQARDLDPRNPEILALLQHKLRQTGGDLERLVEVTGALVDALRDEGHLEEALAIVDELDELDPGSTGVLTRRARLLHRLKRPAEAIETLEALAKIYEAERRRDRLMAVYEQILKVDHDRKDIARALKVLQAGKLGKHRRIAITVGSIILAGALGGWVIHAQRQSSALDVLSARIDKHLEQGDPELARQLVAEWQVSHGSSSEWVNGNTLGSNPTSDRMRSQSARANSPSMCRSCSRCTVPSLSRSRYA